MSVNSEFPRTRRDKGVKYCPELHELPELLELPRKLCFPLYIK